MGDIFNCGPRPIQKPLVVGRHFDLLQMRKESYYRYFPKTKLKLWALKYRYMLGIPNYEVRGQSEFEVLNW